MLIHYKFKIVRNFTIVGPGVLDKLSSKFFVQNIWAQIFAQTISSYYY